MRPLAAGAKVLPYGSKEWKAIYGKRSSVERVNSQLKECRRLEGHCFRGLAKATTHAMLGVAVMQATAVARLREETSKLCVGHCGGLLSRT